MSLSPRAARAARPRRRTDAVRRNGPRGQAMLLFFATRRTDHSFRELEARVVGAGRRALVLRRPDVVRAGRRPRGVGVDDDGLGHELAPVAVRVRVPDADGRRAEHVRVEVVAAVLVERAERGVADGLLLVQRDARQRPRAAASPGGRASRRGAARAIGGRRRGRRPSRGSRARGSPPVYSLAGRSALLVRRARRRR